MKLFCVGTISRRGFRRAGVMLALWAYLAGACALSRTQKPADLLPPGQIVDVTCASDATQSYCCICLPPTLRRNGGQSSISSIRVDADDPLELYKDIAETYGFILAGSNNSRNFSNEQGKAVNAVWQDTHARLGIGEHRSYASGFSGGARVAGAMALSGPTGQVASVIAHGAGYPSNRTAKDDLPYFFAIGDQDFNWPEVINIRREREEQDSPYRVRVYSGRHQWAPASVMEEAMQYMNLKAMQAGNLAADEAFIDRLLDKTRAEAADAESRKDSIAQLSAYRALVSDFGGLRDVKDAAQRLTALQQSAALKAALKSERERMSEQLKLEQETSQKIASVADNSVADITALRLEVRQQMGALNDQAKHSKNEQKRLISGRAFSGIFVGAMEDGQQQLAARHFEKAEAYFDLMRQVSDDPWPVLLLADMHAAAGKSKAGDQGFAGSGAARAEGSGGD